MRPIPRKIRHRRCPIANGDQHSYRCAFTIIELVIVVLVMSILAAAATPAFLDSLLFHRVESAARRLKADLELARQTARLTSAAQTVTFTGSGYTLSDAVKSLDNPHAQYMVNLKAPPFELGGVVANFAGNSSITFDGYGTPTSGGTVVLHAKGHQCTVTLEGTTGHITIDSIHVRTGAAEVTGN